MNYRAYEEHAHFAQFKTGLVCIIFSARLGGLCPWLTAVVDMEQPSLQSISGLRNNKKTVKSTASHCSTVTNKDSETKSY